MRKAALAVMFAILVGLPPARAGETPRRTAAELMDVLMWNREPVGGPFALLDQNGVSRGPEDYREKLLLVYFGFTGCPDICPTDLQEISRALTLLGNRAEAVQPLFVTLDPERDTPAHLKAYLSHFHPRLIGLTGSGKAVAEAAEAYKVFHEKVFRADDYTIDHSAFVYLMDRDGRYLGFFPPGTSAERMLTILGPHLSKP